MDTTYDTNTAEPTLLTVAEAGARLRVSRWTVNRLIQSKQLRTIKIGRRRLVPAQAIEDFVHHARSEVSP